MKLRLVTLAALAVTAVACSRDLGLPDPPPVTGFVTGRVVTAVPGTSQSAPLPGATVTLLSSNLHATTDERGQFLLGPLPEGTYRLFFASKASGTTRQRLLTGVQLKPGATNSVGDVSIQENALLTGRALIQGRATGNVGITIFAPGTDYVTTSADNGGWLLSNLPEGTIRASAWRPGFSPATTTDISLQGGVVTSAVDMILEPEDTSSPAGAILGRVRVLGHEDNAGVTVKALSAQSQTVKATVTTDADGQFNLSDLGPDLYTVTLELTGYPKARVPNLAVAGGVQLELAETIIMAVTGEGNVVNEEPIGGPSGPLFNLDGGLSSPDGGTLTGSDGGTIGAECADDNQCASGRLCVDNRCVGCSLNVQCRPGYSCTSGDCTRDCQSNAECSQGLVCLGGSCLSCITSSDCRDPSLVCNPQAVCAHCRDRSECPAGKACLLTGCGTCGADADCGANSLCEQGVCTVGDCHDNGDCGATQACVGRSCSACSADSQCRASQLCITGACVAGNCRSVLECAAGQVCLNNQCGACANDAQCGAGQLCLPGTGGLRCTAATCRLSSDCTGASAGQLCINNQCLPCGSANPCTNGQICNAQGRCVVGDCFTNLDCTGSKAGWACLAGNCTPCGVNADCAASGYVCVSGICRVGNCSQPSDCAIPGQLCVNNACIGCATTSQCPSGQVCDSDSLCHPGNCITGADCAAGSVCLNRVCSNCTADSQCGLGRLCLGGTCAAGNCRVPGDCPTAGQLCLANSCASCSSSGQCGSGQVCDLDGLCKAGNCVTSANCTAGRLCVARTCADCTSDGQCGSGKICVLGGCVTGVCHSDADCSGGLGLCDTNPGSATAYTCKPCSPLNNASSNTCGTGRVCDAVGLCHFGSCLSNANCPLATPVCTNFNCTTCTQDTQCGSGQLCVNNQCKTGNCHGTGADPNLDCAATNGVCVGNTCVGNCRSNTDCTATGYCDTTSHFCGPCTAPGQCGLGKVCAPGGVGNICITAQCSAMEPNCALGYSCVSGACMQLGPGTTSFDGGYVEPGTFSASNTFSPMALSGANTLYFSGYEQNSTQGGAGTYTVALEPNLTLRWRVKDSNSIGGKNSFGGAGIVLPAPGFPNGELFLANDGNGGAIAHRSDTGAQAWRIAAQPAAFATGVINGVPLVAWGANQNVWWMRTDGSQQRNLLINTCTTWGSIAFGTRAIYGVCGDALYVIDPISGTYKNVPHGGNPSNTFGSTLPAAVAPVWRPPNNYTARGVNSGTVSSDVLVYMGRNTLDWMFAVNIPDDWVTNPTPTSSWTLWSNTNNGFSSTPLAIDATGAIHVNAQSWFYKVNVFTGQQLSRVPIGSYTSWWNLAVNSQVIDVSNNTLQGFLLADGATTTPSSLWTLPATPGPYPPLFPTFQTTATNGGNLLAFQTNPSGQSTLQSMPPGPNAPAFVPTWPATSLAGDSANHATAPAYECTTNAQCAATQSCVLGRCAGVCRDASQCAAGQGCSLGNCGSCSTAASCRTGELCWVGQCIACSGAGCCSTNADCTSGNFCQGGSCRQTPASGLPGGFSVANLITRTQNSNITVAPDGTMYVGDTNASTQPFWKVVTPAGSVSTTPTIPFTLGGAGQLPMAMVASNGSGDSVWHGAGVVLYSAPASSSVGAWTTATYDLFTTGFMRIGQGISSAMTGLPRPTIFGTANSGYSNQYLLAIDAATAAAGGTGNPGLLWTGLLGSTCNVVGVQALDHLLIGSDGTVYVACPDGTVEAWAADGDPTTGPPPSRLGLMKWRSGSPTGWGTFTMTGRPAIGKAPGGDVMYLPRPTAPGGLAILNLATAGNGSLPLEVNVDASVGILTDASGRAIVMGGQFQKQLSIVAPNGAVAYDDKTSWYFSGHGAVLTAEGQLITPEYTPVAPFTQRISGLTVANPNQVALLFTFVGAGGLSTDNNSGVVVLSTSQVSTGLIAFDHVPLTSPGRTFTGYPFAQSQGLMPNAWSAWYGDQQRRNSLKTQ